MTYEDIIHGDCLEVMADMPESSIDMVVTSPPYDNLRTYNGNIAEWGEHVWRRVIEELHRLVVDGGVVVWIVGDATVNGSETCTSFKQALHAVDTGFSLYDTMIYQKGNPPPLNHLRYQQAFEYMFIFSKGKPKSVNLIKIPCNNAGKKNTGTMRNNNSDHLAKKHGYGKKYKDEKPKINIWTYLVGSQTKDANIVHPAKFPYNLPYDHIISWSNEGDTILDPFMGSGTTGVACINTKRNFIGIEKDAEYIEIARARIQHAEQQRQQELF